jgi:predicted ATPase/DNA-binding SARP family transcriptional activator
MDFFGLQAQLDALPTVQSDDAGDSESSITRAWYLRQRDTRRALAECEMAEASLTSPSTPVARRAAARIALVRAEAAWLLGDNDRAQALLTSAREVFTDLADFVGIGDACLCEASLLDQSGGASTAAIRDATAAYARCDDGLRIAVAETWLACIESTASPDSAALRWNATLERARSLSHPGLDTFIEGALASQAYQRGDLAGTVEHFERSFHAALQAGQLFSAITVAQNLGIAFSTLGDDEGALLWVQRARELVEPTGWPYATNWTLVQSASVLAGMGRALAAHEMLSQGLPMLERFRESRNYALATQVLAEVALARNEPAQALAWCECSVSVAARLEFPDLASGSLRFKALALSTLQRPDDAMAAAQEALAIAHEQGHLRHESTALHAMATIARDHALPPPPDSAAPSGSLHHLRTAFEVQRRSGAGVPAEWLAEMSGDLQAAGDLAGALLHQRQATAALAQAKLDKASSLATALQVRQRTESARAEAAQQRALAQASQQQLDLLQARQATLDERAEVSRQALRVAQPASGAAGTDAASRPPGAEPAMLQLLGKPALVRVHSGRTDTLRLLPERRFRLLAYVALHGDGVSRDKLAHLFWPERSQEAARSNLRKLLLEARALDVPQLQSDRNALRWAVHTDVTDFQAALARGDRDAALALYHGPLLDGLDGGDSEAFSNWLARERALLHSAWRDAVVAALPERDPAAVIDLTGRLLADDPFDEDALVAALDAHHARGDGASAAHLFRAYAERLIDELGVEPSVRVRAAAARAEHTTQPPAGAPRRRATDRPGSITAPALQLPGSGFVGRTRELAEISSLLRQAGCRLLTVTGPGGMGKSRLVKHAVLQLDANYSDGVIWIALDDLTEVAQVGPRIASELRLDVGPGKDPLERVCTQLAARHMLLVLDNSEHLGRLASVVERLLAAAPRLQVLSTSRTRIGTAHEWLVPLQGLDLPPEDGTASDIVAADAVQLFALQAQATDPRFKVSANASLVARLVRALGGMPLAVLLAASWVRLLPMTELLNDVTHLLDVLESTEEGEERPEHRSVRATFEQSWRLLVPAEQRAMAVLSVMSGSFTRGAAKEVAQAPLPLLAALVDKSVLQVDGEGRFSLHPLIQQFAAEKLALDPAGPDAARDRHAGYFAQFMSQYEQFESVDHASAVRAIAAELPNVLAAWSWSLTQARFDVVLRCMVGLSNYFQARGPITTGIELFIGALKTLDRQSAPLASALNDVTWGLPLELAALYYWAADYRGVESSGRRALEAARKTGHAYGARTSQNSVALAALKLGQPEEASRLMQEALDGAIADKIDWEIASYAGNLVNIKRELGNDEAALRLAQEALKGHRANGHRIGEISMTNEIGLIMHALGRLAESIDWFERGLKLATGSDMELRRCQLQTHLASAYLDAGQVERARTVCHEALHAALKGGLVSHESPCRRALAQIELAAGDLAAVRAQLRAAIVTARRIGTAEVIGPLLRNCAEFFERTGDALTALRCVAVADAHRVSRAQLLPRFRGQRERLCAMLDAPSRHAVEPDGASLSLLAGLMLAGDALGTE